MSLHVPKAKKLGTLRWSADQERTGRVPRDPDACRRALPVAIQDPPLGVSRQEAVAAVTDILESAGDNCPECLPEADQPS